MTKKQQQIHTEVSRKFELDALADELQSFGFAAVDSYTDDHRRFGTLLLERHPHVS